ncbi:MAG: 3-methyl-2-oxobutanoate hydroxymethyltransferase [Victivallales bacterium]|nr:3-methyl-2-oxobutanoate hydroxymethyltransferase [Victivallales bacterium]
METEKKPTVSYFRRKKEKQEKIVILTAYDATFARFARESGIEVLLVGDSMGNTVLGYDNTIPVTLEQSLDRCAAVRRGAPKAFVIGDMPFMTYQADPAEALHNAARYLKEAGADAIKLEGSAAATAALIRQMVAAGIPVMAHIGLMPQQVLVAGGYRLAGKTEDAARRLIVEAQELEAAGVFAIVLECIPAEVSREITAAVGVPTIGIGAGKYCDGQVQVVHDLLGLGSDFLPKHAKRYVELGSQIKQAFRTYAAEVREQEFPGEANSF